MLADLRNRIFASRRFQDAAASIPGIRRIAAKRAIHLFDLTAGFVYSQVLYALVELELFERLRGGPVPVSTIASEARLPEEAAERLIRAGAALSLLELRSRGRVALGPQGAALLGNSSVFAMVRHHRLLYEDLTEPVALLRAPKGTGKLAAFWGYASGEEAAGLSSERTEAYSALMAATQEFIARDVLEAHDLRRYRRIMDVGGGHGAFLRAVAQKAPASELVLFDLPSVAADAAKYFAGDGLAGRAEAVGGDFLAQCLPAGADLVTLVRILHDHDDSAVETLLRSVHQALPAGGRLLVAEPMAATKGAAAMGDAYFGLYLWAMGTGAPRSAERLRELLRTAGFRRIRLLSTRRPMLTRLILADK